MSYDVTGTIYPQAAEIPWINKEQMLEIERALWQDFGVTLSQMMENAGRNLAQLARVRFLEGEPAGKRVVILAGGGINGGASFVAARRLVGWGATVEIYLGAAKEEYEGEAAQNLAILEQAALPIAHADALASRKPNSDNPCTLIIDGIIGYHLRGAPRDAAAKMIRWANEQVAPVLSLDCPTGLELSGGYVHTPAITATATMTVALPKEGLGVPDAVHIVGELYLADIGVPPALYARPPLYLKVPPIFTRSELVRLR